MANPQPTDAHLRIAHSIQEEIMMRDFSKRQRSIMDLILRLSWGCGKKTAIIPRQKDFELVGIRENKIKSELEWLANAKVIIWNKESNEYGFNKNYDEWRVSIVPRYSKERFIELLKINLPTSRKGNFPKRELPEKGREDFPKREELEPDNLTDEDITSVSKENIKESIYIDINNNARAREDENKIAFSGNVYLTPEEHNVLSKKFKNSLHLVHYICILSKRKTEGYVPDKGDYEELLALINKDFEEHKPP